MNQSQKPLVVKQHQVSRRVGGRSGRSIGFSLLAALVLLGPVILAAEPFPETRESSSGSGGASGLDLEGLLVDDASFDPVNGNWAGLLAELPPHLSPEVVLGPHAHWVFDRDADEVRLREQPETLGEIFDLVHTGTPWERLPVPEPPTGPEPLLTAILAYGDDVDVELPDLDLLRVQIAVLRLVPEAEAALAQLLVAYQEALRLNQEALADLTLEELEILSRQPSAKAAWLKEDPTRTDKDYEDYRRGLSARVDMGKQLAAADLLGRTVDLVREPLALPAAPLADAEAALAAYRESLGGAPGPDIAGSAVDADMEGDDMAAVYRLIADATGSGFDASTWGGVGHPQWDKVYGLIATTTGFDPDTIPEIPQETFPQALRGLASVLGVPGETLELPPELDDLPVSLSNALAQIVTARRLGLESGDTSVHTFLLLEATRKAQPTLEAWAALLNLERHVTGFTLPVMDQREFLLELLQGDPKPSVVLAHSQGLPLPELPGLPAPLGNLLEREGVPAELAQESAEALPLPVSLASSYVLEAIHNLEAVRLESLSPLDEYAQRAIEGDMEQFAEILVKEDWAHEDARLVEQWARSLESLDPQALMEIRQAQLDVLVAVEVAVALAGAYADAVAAGADLVDFLDPELVAGLGIESILIQDALETGHDESKPWYQRIFSFFTGWLVSPASAQDVPDVPEVINPADLCPQHPLSQCFNDIWLTTHSLSQEGREIIITGFGDSTIQRNLHGDPLFMLDLGGDDEYINVAGGGAVADLQPIVVDDDDELTISINPDLSVTPARVAIDLGGDDTYVTDADWTPVAHGAAEGFGTVGILWNRGGDDTYRFTGAGRGAQGFGANGGIGILVDEGGHNIFEAKGVWAHGTARGGPMPDSQALGAHGYLFNLGYDDESTLHAGQGQGYAEGTAAVGLLYNEGRPTHYITENVNEYYQGGHNRGDLARGFLIDLGGAGSSYSNFGLPRVLQYVHHDPDAPRERQDDSAWVDSSNLGSGIGIDTSLRSDTGLLPNLIETLLRHDPQDPDDQPSPGALQETLMDLIENPPDEDDLGLLLNDLLATTFPIDIGMCHKINENGQCERPFNLIHLGGSSDNVITEPAQLMIELGGNNLYQTEVAGAGHFWLNDGGEWVDVSGVGGFSLDLSGDDHYNTPDMSYTQAAVEVALTVPLDPALHGLPVSLLLNLEGDNVYEAALNSQGSTSKSDDMGIEVMRGAAWLIDFEGDDTYSSEARSQGNIFSSRGNAGLIDLAGDDHYRFLTQASLQGGEHGSNSLFFDGGGNDTYQSFAGPHENLWEVQGWSHTQIIQGPANLVRGVGIWVDKGPGYDQFMMGPLDVSQIKNNVTRMPMTIEGEQQGGLFSNNPRYDFSEEDTDGDGAPHVVETLTGTDPNDPEDHPGSFWGDPGSLDSSRLWLRIPGHLAIGGRNDNTFDEHYAFTVSLGGDNVYTAPGIGGAFVNGVDQKNSPVTLLLDIGGGDNVYTATLDEEGVCHPSLGSAVAGVAVLADAGGSNRFLDDCGGEATQGAAGPSGVGLLGTWDATNSFDAPSSALAQGAADSGFGFLGAFGKRDQEFRAPDGRAQGHGKANGLGVLWTGTGDDRFSAGPESQGYGENELGFGLLYSAGGNDVLQIKAATGATAGGQGAGVDGGAGMLLNLGGDDEYLASSLRLTQGAGSDGAGLLIDLGGQDTYVALNHAQGYAIGNAIGLLFDVHGRDAYTLMETEGQGYSMEGGCGILINGGGENQYTYGGEDVTDERRDSVWMQEDSTACGIGMDDMIFQDLLTTGRDTAPHGIDEVSLRVSKSDVGIEEWEMANGTLNLLAEIKLRDSELDPEQNVRRVVFFANNRLLGEGEFKGHSDGVAIYEYLWNTQNGDFPDGDYLLRASASAAVDRGLDGGGVAAPDLPAVHSEEFPLSVDNPPVLNVVAGMEIPTISDGRVNKPALQKFMEKEELDIAISPTLGYGLTLSLDIGRDISFPEGSTLEGICEDVAAWVGLEGECDPTRIDPGAILEVTVRDESGETAYHPFNLYLPTGTFQLAITPIDPDGNPWADGRYDLEVLLEDAGGKMTEEMFSLLVDGSAPVSQITTPDHAGTGHGDRGSGRLNVEWDHEDEWSVVREVAVFRLAQDGTVSQQEVFSADRTNWQIQTDGTGSVVQVVTVAVDVLGNLEHTCDGPDAPWPCLPPGASTVEIEVDFEAPRIERETLKVFPDPVAPGEEVVVEVEITDIGSGLEEARIRFDNFEPGRNELMTCELMTGERWNCSFHAWGDENTDYFEGTIGNRERPFTFRITAVDLAANLDIFTGSGFIDEEPPRVFPLDVTYWDGDVEHAAGRPGFTAILLVDIEDYAMGTLVAKTDQVADVSTKECNLGPEGWLCSVPIRAGLADGDYEVRFVATDKAGNRNDTVSQTLVVRGDPVEISDVKVVPAHDGFRVNWTTSRPATSEVDHGRVDPGADARLDHVTRVPGLRTEHSVTVTDLHPSTPYLVQIHSVNEGGVASRGERLSVATLNAYRFDWAGVEESQAVRGDVVLDTTMEILSGTAPVQTRVLLQEVREGDDPSPFEVATFPHHAGGSQVTVSTKGFADGDYRFVFELNRLGDFNRSVSQVFRIDNTPPVVVPISPSPGSTVKDTRPLVVLELMDPMGRSPPLNHTLAVQVGEEIHPVPAGEIFTEVLGPVSKRVEFRLPASLQQGSHTLNVSVADEAGNVGHSRWSLQVDHLPPRLEGDVQVAPLPGPDHLKPGGLVRVVAVIVDESHVTNATLDLSPLGGDLVQLLAYPGDRWEVTAQVPGNAAHGNHVLPVRATDSLGNEGIVANFSVFVDARPVEIASASATDWGYTWVLVRIATDEPTLAWGGHEPPTDPFLEIRTSSNASWQDRHEILVEHLRPDMEYELVVEVVDRAGHRASTTVEVRTLRDDEPPTAVGDLKAVSEEEGMAVLTWEEAQDNAGIDHYLIVRSAALHADAFSTKVPGNETIFRDLDAPGGREVTYSVTAVDVAGQEGPSSSVTLSISAFPTLSDPSVTPLRGASTEPFTFQVTYRHAGDAPPDDALLRIGSESHPLHVQPGAPCRTGCLLEARIHVSPTTQFDRVGVATFHATTGGHEADPVSTPLPLVHRSAGDGGVLFGQELEDIPGPAIVFILLVLSAFLGLASLLRQRRCPA